MPELDTTAMDLAAQLKAKIDNFEVGVDASPGASHARVLSLLGRKNMKKLYGREAPLLPEEDYPKTAREAFIDHLIKVLNTKPDFSFHEFGEEPPPEGTPAEKDPRALDPEKYCPSLKQFLELRDDKGKIIDGEKLFEAAIAEEGNSTNYLNAVFLNCITDYPGKKWLERLTLIIGGPSASGKTFSSNLAIERLINDGILGEDPNDHVPEGKGNKIVAIDGSIERKISQMRQLVLQVALNKGYPGINNLNKYTHLQIKKNIQEAVIGVPDLNLVIAETFANPFKRMKYSPREFEKKVGGKLIYAEIQAGFEEQRIKTPVKYEALEKNMKHAVSRSGVDRSFSTDFNQDRLRANKIRMNNLDIKVESKGYEPEYYDDGVDGSRTYREDYQEYTKTNIYMPIVPDRIPVIDQNGDWIACVEDYPGKPMLISMRDLQKWHQYKENHYQSKGMPNGISSPSLWYQEYVKRHYTSDPEIRIYDHRVELPPKPTPARKEKEQHYELRLFSSSVPDSAVLESKDPEVDPAYAQVTKKGLGKLLEASTTIGSLGRIFDTPKPDEIPPAMRAWLKQLFDQFGLSTNLLANPLFNEESVHDYRNLFAVMPHLISPNVKACAFLVATDLPNKEDLFASIRSDAAYIKYIDPKSKQAQLYYFCKTRNELTPIPISANTFTKLEKSLSIKIDSDPQVLKQSDLMTITQLTHHQHQAEYHDCDSIFDHQGHLAPWLRNFTPPGSEHLYEGLLKAIYNKAVEISLTPQGKLQPWLIKAIEKPLIEAKKEGKDVPTSLSQLIKKKDETYVATKIIFALMTAFREAIDKCNPYTDKTSREYQALDGFLKTLDLLIDHMGIYYKRLLDILQIEKSSRHIDNYLEPRITAQIKTLKKIQRDLLSDPLMDISTIVEQTKELFAEIKDDRNQDDIIEESISVRSQANTSAATTQTPTLFQAKNVHARLSSDNTASAPVIAPRIINLEFEQRNGTLIHVSLDETASLIRNSPVSDISELDERLDPVKFLANFVFQNRAIFDIFNTLEEAEDFFESAINDLKITYGEISKLGLEAIIERNFESHLSPKERAFLTDSLFKTYKNTMEQLNPYPADDTAQGNPYDKHYFPCDALLRLAKHHVDTFRQLTGKQKTGFYLSEDCFDPHYYDAVWHYCDYLGISPPNYVNTGKGWEMPDFPRERRKAFKALWEQRFEVHDKKAQPAPTLAKDLNPPTSTSLPANRPSGFSR